MASQVAGVILPWDGRVEGLGDGAGELPIWGGTLAGCAADALTAAGLPITDLSIADPSAADTISGEAIVVAGGCALRADAVRAALDAGRAEGTDQAFQLGGRAGELIASAAGGAPPGGLWYLAPGGSGPLLERLEAAASATLEPEERAVTVPFPGQPTEFPLSDRLFVPVRHWITGLWANLLGLGPYLWGALLGASPVLAALRGVGGVLRARSADPERIAAALTRRRAGARIHHSAIVEACVLGEGARVEAGAVVRGCVLGPGAVVEALAVCEGAVLGAGALLQRQALFKFGVLGPGASFGGATQLSVLGSGAVLKLGAFGMDISLAGSVRVRFADRLVEAPLGMAGLCLGDRALVGSGVWVAPGRAIPPGVTAVADEVLVDPRCDGPGVYRVQSGGLVPVGGSS